MDFLNDLGLIYEALDFSDGTYLGAINWLLKNRNYDRPDAMARVLDVLTHCVLTDNDCFTRNFYFY